MTARFRLEDLPPSLREQVERQLAPRGTVAPASRPSKYRNQVITVAGDTFGSKWELKRFGELQEQERLGLICELRHHVAFALQVMTPIGDFVRIASYEADFVYRRGEELVIEDTKSEPTRRKEAYQLKAKMFEAEYGLRIVEVLRARRRRAVRG